MSNSGTGAAKPRYKKKGPIRFEAIVPFAIVTGLIVLYVVLFLDLHIRKGIEWAAGQANGAQVDVGSVKTSFWNASLRISKIEVTNPEKTDRNRFEIGQIEFKALWDALLRGKVVVELAGITDIQVNTARSSPGRIIKSESRSAFMTGIREQVTEAALGDVARLLDGFDPAKDLKDVGNLKSLAAIESLQKELDAKEKEWGAMLQSVPGTQELAAVQGKVNSLKIGGTNNPAELAKQVKAAEGVVKEAQTQVASVQGKVTGLVGDIGSFGGKVGAIDELAAQDRKDIEGKLKLPKLDPAGLSEQLFGEMIQRQLGSLNQYVELARSKMPPQGAKSGDAKVEKKLVVAERGKGRTYEFGRPNSYPAFWLKRAVISSKLQNTEFGGDVSGEIRDVTSNQPQLGRPTVAELRGAFPKQRVDGVTLKAVMDHRGETASDSLDLAVASFPVVDRVISGSDQLKLSFASAIGSMRVGARLQGDALRIQAGSEFRQVDYRVASSNQMLESVVSGVVKGVPTVTVDAEVTGSLSKPSVSISSNLGAALARGFGTMLQAKVGEARQKVDRLIDEKIGKQKAMLTERYAALSKKFGSQAEEKKKAAEGLQSQANAKLDDAKKQATQGAQKKGVNAVKKKLPFGR